MTPAVALRPPAASDAPRLLELAIADRPWIAEFEPLRPGAFYTLEGQRGRVDASLAQEAVGAGLGRVILVDGVVCGWLGISNVSRGVFQSANLGYWVAREKTGLGVATAAVACAVAEAFGPLGLRRLEAGTLVRNVASQRVLRKNAFEPFGLAREYLVIAGRPQDHVLFQRLARNDDVAGREPPAGVVVVRREGALAAVHEGATVGRAGLARPAGAAFAALRLEVDRPLRCRGIGSELLRRLLADARADGVRRVEVALPLADPATSFLLRRGFLAEGVRRASVRADDRVVLAHVADGS